MASVTDIVEAFTTGTGLATTGLAGVAIGAGLPNNTGQVFGGISADSEPDADGWGFDTYWDCSDWINYHKALVSKYGTADGTTRWAKAFDDAAGYLGHEINCASKNDDFKAYIAANGLDKASTKLSQLGRAISFGDALHAPVANLGAAFNNVTAGIKNATASTATIATFLPWILLAAGLLMAWLYFSSNTQKSTA